jgi:FeS assembly SUF system protein
MRWFRQKKNDAPAGPPGPAGIRPEANPSRGLDQLGMVAPPAAAPVAPPAAAPVAPPAAAPVAPPAAAPEPLPHPAPAGAAAAAPPVLDDVVDVLRTVYDPEIPVNIYDIGLIYDLQVDGSGRVAIRMTLTSPMCPVAESLPPEVQAKVAAVPGVTDAQVELVWDPPWHPGMMSEEARLLLNIF